MRRSTWVLNGPALAVLVGACAGETRPDSLTLVQAVSMALEHQPLIEQAEHVAAASEARVGSSRSALYPDISAAGLYTRIDPVPSMDMPGMGSLDFYPHNNYDVHLGLRQTLYDFGRVETSVRLAESARKNSADYLDLVKSNLAYQTAAVFDGMLILGRSVAVIDEEIAALRQHLDMSVKKIRAGTATDFDSLTTEVRIAVAESKKIDAVSALENQEVVLRRLTGLPEDRPAYPKGALELDARDVNADSARAAAEKQRPELVLAKDAEASAGLQVELASLGDKPSLTLNVMSGFKNGYVPDLDEWKANLAGGVQLQVPIFNGGRTRYQKQEAEANLRAARAHTADLERQIASEVDQALVGVESSLEKIRSTEVQVRQAEQALAKARTHYEAGVATNLDLLDAQTALSEAKLVRLRAIYEYTISLNALDKATGRKIW